MTPDSANAKTVAPFRAKAASTSSLPGREDATFEFASENSSSSEAGGKAFPVAIKVRKPMMVALAAGIGALAVAGSVWAALTFRPAVASTGSLNVESDPSGAEVRIDDTLRGTTPLLLSVPAGSHTLAVQHGSNVKRLNIEIAGGTANAYHVAWAEPASVSPAPVTGSLSVVSDPPGSAVVVDGTARGQTPVTIRELSAGRHDVLVRSTGTTYQRSVQVEAGTTVSLVVGGAAASIPSWGWITLKTPFTVQVLETGRVVGTSEIDRIMLSPGSHELDFVSDAFGFRQSSKVNVSAGRGDLVSLTIPRVAMNINALPWAEVFIDGARIGDTPLANVMQPIGDHEVVFRHPQLGEKRQAVRLMLGESVRVSVDMRSR